MRCYVLAVAIVYATGVLGCSEPLLSPEVDDPETAREVALGKMGDVPFKAEMLWAVTPNLAPGFPFGRSTFGGRCSVPSTWVLEYAVEGNASHMGNITGEGSHCAIVEFGPDGSIIGGSGSDAVLELVAANGDQLLEIDRNMTETGVLASGAVWWSEDWQILKGTGRFEGAVGEGSLFGVFAGFEAPSIVSVEGTLRY